jgi:hypothetical protein
MELKKALQLICLIFALPAVAIAQEGEKVPRGSLLQGSWLCSFVGSVRNGIS